MNDIADILHARAMEDVHPRDREILLSGANEIDRLRKALTDVVAWAESLEPYSDIGTHMVPVFTHAKEALK